MLAPRIFPRYQVKKFNQKICIDKHENLDILLFDVSLIGMGLVFNQNIAFGEELKFTITFAKFHCNLQGQIIWQVWDAPNREGRAGIKLFFENKGQFTQYLTFIKSLHQLRMKRVKSAL